MRLDTLIPGATALEITGITADSRKVRPGYLFAALHGVAKEIGRAHV
jgi:UDP-N-acetylmuramoyl-L-alanyl-D-glutamate--2,6-diaminopimelate ligase